MLHLLLNGTKNAMTTATNGKIIILGGNEVPNIKKLPTNQLIIRGCQYKNSKPNATLKLL
jgi:hypothetical protein